MEENVLSYCPVTASAFVKEKGIADADNPVWNLENIKKNGINYTEFDTIKSESDNYSSCGDAKKYICEELKKIPGWKSKTITRVSKKIYKEVHSDDISKLSKWGVKKLEREIKKYFDPNFYKSGNFEWVVDSQRWLSIYEKIIDGEEVDEKKLKTVHEDLYVNRKRELEFCNFMKQDKEKEAMENGINYLNMNELTKTKFYKPGEFGLYIMNTPNRKIITRYLAEEAIKMSYKRKLKSTLNRKK